MSINLPAIFVALLTILLLVAAWTDVRRRTIANELNLVIAILAIGWWWVCGEALWPDVAIRIAIAVAVFIVFAGLFAFGMMGGGDVKMIAAIALWLPFPLLMAMLTVMAIAGGVITLLVLIVHRWRRSEGRPEVPYGVAIAIGALWVSANGLLTLTAA
ncbi:MAG: peptidase [Rhizorhabdus sp.]|nr:peptidase [Rhizorhabdus sp.]